MMHFGGRAAAGLGRVIAADAIAADLRRSTAPLRRLVDGLRTERPTGWLDDIDDAGERFQLAAARYGRTDADLRAALRGLYRHFSLFFVASAAFFALAVTSAAGWTSALAALGGLAAFAPAAVLALLAARAAFYHWQIRTRRLSSLGEWLRQPGEWIPLSSAASRAHRATVAALFLLLAAAPVAAATTGAAQDQALTIINALLPLGGTGPATATALSTALQVMTSTLLLAAASLIGYQIIAAIIAAAHEGRVLSGRYHGIWAPIRLVLGAGLLPPVLGGFSPVHLLIYQLAIGASSMATSTWAAYVGAVLSPTPAAVTAGVGIPPSVGGTKLAEEILENEVCAATTLAVEAAESSASGVVVSADAALPDPGGAPVTSGSAMAQTWGYQWRCGGFSIPIPPSTAPAPVVTFSAAQISAISALVSAVRDSGVATQIAQWQSSPGSADFPTGILTTLTTAAQSYDSAMLSAAATLTAAQNAAVRSNLTAAASAGGWTQAFAYDRALAQASEQTAAAASVSPAWAAPQAPDGDEKSAATVALKALNAELQKERGAGTLTASDLAAAGQSGDGFIAKVLEPIDHRISAAVLDFTAADPTDPVADLMNLGAKLSAAGEAGVTAAIGLAIPAGNVVAKAAGLDLAFTAALRFCSPVIWGALAAGWVLQFLLPILPWIAGLWLVVSWVVETVVVVLAAPLWAVLMVKLDGQELVDSAHKPFLVSVAAWALKPALGVLGYIAYRLLVSLVFPLLTAGFSTAYVGAQGGRFVGLSGVIGGTLLLSWLSWQMMLRLTGLVLTIGDRVLGALGLGGAGSDAETHHNRTIAVASAGRGGGQLGGGGGGGSGGGGGGPSGRGGAPGVRPARGGSGRDFGRAGLSTINDAAEGAAEAHWSKATGGAAGLSDGQRAAAQSAFESWSADNPRAAARYGFSGYVDYAQTREAQST